MISRPLLFVEHRCCPVVRSIRSSPKTGRCHGLIRASSQDLTPAQISLPAWPKVSRVRLRTHSDCELEVSVYPSFAYNAVGGGGYAQVEDLGNGLLRLTFDPDDLFIPDLSFRTASIFKLPLPPPLKIAIKPLKLLGTLDRATGEVNLEFSAEFVFTAGPFYKAAPLQVRTVLTTGSTAGRFKRAMGHKLGPGNRARLVGVAQVPKVDDDLLLNLFLMLPTDALAIMSAEFEFEY